MSKQIDDNYVFESSFNKMREHLRTHKILDFLPKIKKRHDEEEPDFYNVIGGIIININNYVGEREHRYNINSTNGKISIHTNSKKIFKHKLSKILKGIKDD